MEDCPYSTACGDWTPRTSTRCTRSREPCCSTSPRRGLLYHSHIPQVMGRLAFSLLYHSHIPQVMGRLAFSLQSSVFSLHTTLDTRHCFTRLPHPPMNDPHEPPTTTCNIDVPLVKAYYTIHSSLRRGVAAAGRARAGGGSPGQGAD